MFTLVIVICGIFPVKIIVKGKYQVMHEIIFS